MVVNPCNWQATCASQLVSSFGKFCILSRGQGTDSCLHSVVSPQFWWLVVARGVVGIGSSGMAYMVALILNGDFAFR